MFEAAGAVGQNGFAVQLFKSRRFLFLSRFFQVSEKLVLVEAWRTDDDGFDGIKQIWMLLWIEIGFNSTFDLFKKFVFLFVMLLGESFTFGDMLLNLRLQFRSLSRHHKDMSYSLFHHNNEHLSILALSRRFLEPPDMLTIKLSLNKGHLLLPLNLHRLMCSQA